LSSVTEEATSGGDFKGKSGTSVVMYTGGKIPAKRLMMVGLGERGSLTTEKLRRVAATVIRKARSLEVESAAVSLPLVDAGNMIDSSQAITEGAILGLYRFDRYRTNGRETEDLETFTIIFEDSEDAGDVEGGVHLGERTARAALLARDLANEPSNIATPEYLANKARDIATEHGMDITVLDRAGIEAEGLTGLATVGQSASNEPRFIVMEYWRSHDESAPPTVLIGKSVTFDSGGISIKPTGGMEDMKFDMCGGAAVLGAMQALGELDLPINVVALIPATENLPAGDAFKPGDILTMHSGKTVEILTTDAEGRLILADALSYAKRYEPAAVIDCATLTGACIIALGDHASGLMGNDEDLITKVQKAGEAVGERAWPLPLFQEYTDQIKGDYADIKNSGGRGGGALTAGAFLKEFADFPWAHLDIAGTSFGKKGNPYTTKGAAGVPARTLVQFLREID
jgi:leucyl aminopeptidase